MKRQTATNRKADTVTVGGHGERSCSRSPAVRHTLLACLDSRRVLRVLTFLVLLVGPLSACTLSPSNGATTPTSAVRSTALSTMTSAATPNPTTTPSAVSAVETSSAPTSTPSPAPTVSPTVASSPPSSTPSISATPAESPSADVIAAVKQVIQKGNQEEEQALASNDPTVMQDTSTPDYYNELLQDVQSLAASGITAIHLFKLEWGSFASRDASTVSATTYETWDTTLGEQGTLRQTDTNVYTLVLQNGSWKIQADEHPDSNPPQSAQGSSGSSGNPGASTTPADSSSASENWAGYAATDGSFTAVSASWTVPAVTATTSRAADATWVGIGGINANDLIQAGTEAIVENGDITYAAWIETLPQPSKEVALTIKPGDKVHVSLEQQSTGKWLIAIQNLTSGQSYNNVVSYQSSLSSAEWIEEAPTSGGRFLMPIDDFGSITFSNATATENGQQETLAKSNAQAISMQYTRTQALVTTSSIGSDGTSFTVTRTDVPAPANMPGGRRYHG